MKDTYNWCVCKLTKTAYTVKDQNNCKGESFLYVENKSDKEVSEQTQVTVLNKHWLNGSVECAKNDDGKAKGVAI